MKIKKKILKKVIKEAKEEYDNFFRSALDKFGVSSPGDLDGVKKKEFFNYVDKNWNAGENETDVDEGCSKKKKKKKKKKVTESTIKFNLGKMMKLIEKDKFLNYAFKSNKGSDKKKAEKLFNDHIIGDKGLEKKYNES